MADPALAQYWALLPVTAQYTYLTHAAVAGLGRPAAALAAYYQAPSRSRACLHPVCSVLRRI